jgi:hypothetical protein
MGMINSLLLDLLILAMEVETLGRRAQSDTPENRIGWCVKMYCIKLTCLMAYGWTSIELLDGHDNGVLGLVSFRIS